MGTEIKTKMLDHATKEFWGGDQRGVCLQVTASSPLRIKETIADQLHEEGFIQLTMTEAAALCNDLQGFVKREAMRRQELLRAQINQLKMAEKTVFQEVAALPLDFIDTSGLVVSMVAKLCPTSSEPNWIR